MNFQDEEYIGLPGEKMIRKGLEDFAVGKQTIESLLLQIGSPRLRNAGIKFDGPIDPDADYRLYDLLCETHDDAAFSQYNAWIRHLVSFERALEGYNGRRSGQT